MVQYAEECRTLKLPYIFDPGQQCARMSGEELRDGLFGSHVVICNDYEFELMRQKTALGQVDVLAHTDTTGTPQVNQALSDKRAAAVATYLSGHGVGKSRIASRGYGESAPLYVPDDTETKKAGNRRVEIRLMPYRG